MLGIAVATRYGCSSRGERPSGYRIGRNRPEAIEIWLRPRSDQPVHSASEAFGVPHAIGWVSAGVRDGDRGDKLACGDGCPPVLGQVDAGFAAGNASPLAAGRVGCSGGMVRLLGSAHAPLVCGPCSGVRQLSGRPDCCLGRLRQLEPDAMWIRVCLAVTATAIASNGGFCSRPSLLNIGASCLRCSAFSPGRPGAGQWPFSCPRLLRQSCGSRTARRDHNAPPDRHDSA
jgi:hypothetical protein